MKAQPLKGTGTGREREGKRGRGRDQDHPRCGVWGSSPCSLHQAHIRVVAGVWKSSVCLVPATLPGVPGLQSFPAAASPTTSLEPQENCINCSLQMMKPRLRDTAVTDPESLSNLQSSGQNYVSFFFVSFTQSFILTSFISSVSKVDFV